MSSELRLTLGSRDREILETLTLRVRLLSLAQVARTWWADTTNAEANARARLKLLEQAQLISSFTAMARPEINLAEPVIRWEPGQESPNFGAASYKLQSRFFEAPRRTPCVIATPQAGVRFGGKGGRFPKSAEQTHDLHMGALFLIYRQAAPDLIRYWVSEETIKRTRPKIKGEKLPDAMIRTETWQKVVEFGGAYSKEKLRQFHAYCEKHNFPYEVW